MVIVADQQALRRPQLFCCGCTDIETAARAASVASLIYSIFTFQLGGIGIVFNVVLVVGVFSRRRGLLLAFFIYQIIWSLLTIGLLIWGIYVLTHATQLADDDTYHLCSDDGNGYNGYNGYNRYNYPSTKGACDWLVRGYRIWGGVMMGLAILTLVLGTWWTIVILGFYRNVEPVPVYMSQPTVYVVPNYPTNAAPPMQYPPYTQQNQQQPFVVTGTQPQYQPQDPGNAYNNKSFASGEWQS